MASQIEETLASLTILSGQYTAQVDDLSKRHELSFQGFRSATLAAIKKALRRIESDALVSRSPIKSVRKKTRRKLKKSTRTRRTKPKPHAPPQTVIDSAHRNDSDNGIPLQSSAPKPLRQNRSKRPGTETEREPQADSSLPSSPPIPVNSLGTSREEPEKRPFAIRRVVSQRITRSTASFQSAVESPILAHPKDKTIDDPEHNASPKLSMPPSPEIGESQWKDCRSKPEPGPHYSKRFATGKGPVPGGNELDVEEAPIAPLKLNNADDRGSQPKLNASRPNKHRGEITKNASQQSDTEHKEHGNARRTRPYEEDSIGNHPPKADLPRDSRRQDKQEVPIPAHRKKRGAGLATTGSQPAQDVCDSKGKREEKTSMDPPVFDIHKSTGMRTETSGYHDHAKSSKSIADKGSSINEDITDGSKSTTDGSHPGNMRDTDFEFKAPKPRSMPTLSTSRPLLIAAVPSNYRTSDIQTPKAQTQKSTKADAPIPNMDFQKQFAVDEGGKIDDAGIGLLSEIAATPTRGNEASAIKHGDDNTVRGTKLFKPTTDIYSAHRKPVLSRVLSVQKSNMSSRTSFLSHTPGAHAPTARLEKRSMLREPSSSNLRESLAALKQPITDSKPTRPKLDEKPDKEATLNDQSTSSLHSDDHDNLTLTGGKILKFAERYRQFNSIRSQSVRALEPQTAPTKEFGQPRIRREGEKSAFRRRIEEIRGKASASTVWKNTSRRSSSDDNPLRSSSEGNPNSRRSALAETTRSPKHSHKGTAELEEVPSEPKALDGAVHVVLSTESEQRNSLPPEQVSKGIGEHERSSIKEKAEKPDSRFQRGVSGSMVSGMAVSRDPGEDEIGSRHEVEAKTETGGSKAILSNLVSSVSTLYPAASSLLGVRKYEERREETDAEVAAKRQRLDVERREAERQARLEAQRATRQKEAEEKQKRAEARRQLLAEAEKAKEEERKRKEEHRKRVKQQEEEERKRKKLEEDRKKGERRRQVLQKKALNMELESKRKGTKGVDGKRVRHGKAVDRVVTGLPKASGLNWTAGKGAGMERNFGKGISPTLHSKQAETSYSMTPAKATVIEDSDEESKRRRHKVIPQWADDKSLAISTRSQPDPDRVFVNMPMCNLREVFGEDKQYRTRSSSANWTQDRVTTSEMTKYKRAVGGFGDV